MMRTRRPQREVATRRAGRGGGIVPIHSAVLGLLVGHNPVEAALGPTVLAVLAEAALGPIHSAALVKTALGPPALAVLVDAALGPIHSAALVETAVGPIHGAVLRRSPSPALPVEPAFGRLLGDAIGNQVGVASDVPAEAALVDAVQGSAGRRGAALDIPVGRCARRDGRGSARPALLGAALGVLASNILAREG
jgi:hypothetical protein